MANAAISISIAPSRLSAIGRGCPELFVALCPKTHVVQSDRGLPLAVQRLHPLGLGRALRPQRLGEPAVWDFAWCRGLGIRRADAVGDFFGHVFALTRSNREPTVAEPFLDQVCEAFNLSLGASDRPTSLPPGHDDAGHYARSNKTQGDRRGPIGMSANRFQHSAHGARLRGRGAWLLRNPGGVERHHDDGVVIPSRWPRTVDGPRDDDIDMAC